MPRPADRMPAAVEATTAPEQEAEAQEQPAEASALVASAPAAEAATATEALNAIALPKQPVRLTAQITENGMNIPEGLVWRVFDTRTDASGGLALAAKSESAAANFELSPGKYVVHVAYGRAQATETIDVAEGGSDWSIVLDAGALRLNAAITGDVSIPINLLRFDISRRERGGSNDRGAGAGGQRHRYPQCRHLPRGLPFW